MTTIPIPQNLPTWIQDHIRLYLEDPEAAHHFQGANWETGPLATLLLVTTGRSSGELRPVPLIYGESDGSYVVIASKGGAKDHPAWYRNLEAHPECEIRVGSRILRAKARTASGDERKRLWKQLAEIYPPYDEYQVSAGERRIPVVVLEPVSS